jgi:hypothetical protein
MHSEAVELITNNYGGIGKGVVYQIKDGGNSTTVRGDFHEKIQKTGCLDFLGVFFRVPPSPLR